MLSNQNYPTSGFAENNITLGLHVCTQNILITYENDIPWDKSQLFKIWIRGNKITLGLNFCNQNMGITYGDDIPWGQIKMTQNLDSQKIQ